MTPHRVAITGIGAITAAGSGAGDAAGGLWDGVLAERRGIRRITRFDASTFRSQVAAEIDTFDPLDYMPARAARRLDRFAQLAVAAGTLALADAGISPCQEGRRAAVYVGSALGGIAYAEAQHAMYVGRGLRGVDPALALAVFGGSAATALALEIDARGPAMGNADSCASGAIALGEAFRLVRSGAVPYALAGGAEAPLAPLTFGSFTVIRAMSGRNDCPGEACRPFDAGRDGFVMGEGSAVLVLEPFERAIHRGARIYAEIIGYSTTNDAYHVTAPRPDGSEAARAVRLALDDAGIAPEAVDYVNAHGSSTPAGDRAEAVALAAVFGPRLPLIPVSGTKPLHGHPLGASGAIEAAIVALALHHQRLPAAVNFCAALPGTPEAALMLVSSPAPCHGAEVALSNSFGFGGINAALLLRRWPGV